jgi:hypothetical protein
MDGNIAMDGMIGGSVHVGSVWNQGISQSVQLHPSHNRVVNILPAKPPYLRKYTLPYLRKYTSQLLNCCVIWEPLCVQGRVCACVSVCVCVYACVCVCAHVRALCTQTVAHEQSTPTCFAIWPSKSRKTSFFMQFLNNSRRSLGNAVPIIADVSFKVIRVLHCSCTYFYITPFVHIYD